MKYKIKLKHKIIGIVLVVSLLLSVLALQASAFVNLTPSNSGLVYYAKNPISDIETGLISSDKNGDVSVTPAHISVLSSGTNGVGKTSGIISSGRPSYLVKEMLGLYQVETNSSRIWTTLGKDNSFSADSNYDTLEGLQTKVTVRFDTYIVNNNMGSELNFEIPSDFRTTMVDVTSRYYGNVSYPKLDGSLGGVYFELSFENTYSLSTAPDGNKPEHIKVRHFTSPTYLYPNQNPQYVSQMAVYRDAYERLDDSLKKQYVHPDNIQRWIEDEGYSMPPICTNYTSEYNMRLSGSDTPMLATSVVVGTFAGLDTWTGTYGNYLDINSSVSALKATASKYDFTEVLTNAINNTMNVQIFPDFKIGEIFLIVGGLGILVLLLKIFLGG